MVWTCLLRRGVLGSSQYGKRICKASVSCLREWRFLYPEPTLTRPRCLAQMATARKINVHHKATSEGCVNVSTQKAEDDDNIGGKAPTAGAVISTINAVKICEKLAAAQRREHHWRNIRLRNHGGRSTVATVAGVGAYYIYNTRLT